MFQIRNLSVLAYANGFTLWHYRTSATLAEVVAPSFFADASDMFASGDLIIISAMDGGRIVSVASVGHGDVLVGGLT